VDPGRQTWRCFGACSEGGDVAKFLMKIDGISFPAALEPLARKGGINFPNGGSKEESERRNLLNVLRRAQQFYHNSLLQNQNGAKAYVGSRMTEDMVRQFGIGFAPVGGKALVDFLDKKTGRNRDVSINLKRGDDIERVLREYSPAKLHAVPIP
jgi:DNA primase